MKLQTLADISLLRLLGEKKEETLNNNETAIFKVSAPIFEAGLVGKYNIRDVEDAKVYYPQTTVEKMYNSIKIGFTPVDTDHDNKAIGKVIEKFKNDKGYTSPSGKQIEADHLYHVIMEVELPENFDFNNASVSVENTVEDMEPVTDGHINNVEADFQLNDSLIEYVSIITDRKKARVTQTQRLYNSLDKENLDNNINMNKEEVNIHHIMTPEEKNSLKESIKNEMIEDLREEFKNQFPVKEEAKEEDLENSDISGYKEIREMIQGVLEKLSGLENSLKNTKEEEKKEDLENSKEEEEKKEDSLKNSNTEEFDIKSFLKN